jgi:putative membrane protein
VKKIVLLIALICTLTACSDGKAKSNISGTGSLDLGVLTAETTAENASETITVTENASETLNSTEIIAETEDEQNGDMPFDVEIKEKLFVAQSNDIYYNADDYMGKIIKYEGIFTEYTEPDTGVTYYSVIRYGPGCCGIDANCGFEVAWVGDDTAVYPANNEWVEVLGTLDFYEEDGYKYLRIDLNSLTVLSERGAEYVSA